MGRIPFTRVAAAFDADVERVRPCETLQGSADDLSDLVFLHGGRPCCRTCHLSENIPRLALMLVFATASGKRIQDSRLSSLLAAFPLIFVGKLEELKQVVKLMCTAIEGSMKSMDMYMPPWRRIGYMQAKWFSSYQRTTDEVATTKKTSSAFSTARSIEFHARPVKSYNCRDDYGSKPVFGVFHLTTAFYTDGPGMLNIVHLIVFLVTGSYGMFLSLCVCDYIIS
ncbi:hypothetical protein Fmac_013686 [Flemingia macrophylla]|uniref:Uncharacterized protein n=1 Tax=Flemingia macrophylla TaxID=520843 RepID=A0ABD1MTU0_9FABA